MVNLNRLKGVGEMKTISIFNPSTLMMDKAKCIKCKHCNGFGGIAFEDDRCFLCNGYGRVWSTGNGLYKALYARQSQFY